MLTSKLFKLSYPRIHSAKNQKSFFRWTWSGIRALLLCLLCGGFLFFQQVEPELTMASSGEDPVTTVTVKKTAQDLNGPPLMVGDIVRYTIEVENTGDAKAYQIEVVDDLPDGVICQSVTATKAPPEGCADPLNWTIWGLKAGHTASLFIDVLLTPDTADQDVINGLEVTGANIETIPADELPEVCPDGTPVQRDGTCPHRPALATTTVIVDKTAQDLNGLPLMVGDVIRYTIQVVNTGDVTAFDLEAIDNLPDVVMCQSVSGDHAPAGCADPLIWSIPPLAPDGIVSLTIDVVLLPEGMNQSIINTVQISGSNIKPLGFGPAVCPDGRSPLNNVCANKPMDPSRSFTLYMPLVAN